MRTLRGIRAALLAALMFTTGCSVQVQGEVTGEGRLADGRAYLVVSGLYCFPDAVAAREGAEVRVDLGGCAGTRLQLAGLK